MCLYWTIFYTINTAMSHDMICNGQHLISVELLSIMSSVLLLCTQVYAEKNLFRLWPDMSTLKNIMPTVWQKCQTNQMGLVVNYDIHHGYNNGFWRAFEIRSVGKCHIQWHIYANLHNYVIQPLVVCQDLGHSGDKVTFERDGGRWMAGRGSLYCSPGVIRAWCVGICRMDVVWVNMIRVETAMSSLEFCLWINTYHF